MKVAQVMQPGTPARKNSELLGCDKALLTTRGAAGSAPIATFTLLNPYASRVGPSTSASMYPITSVPVVLFVSAHGNHWSASMSAGFACSLPGPDMPPVSPPVHV